MATAKNKTSQENDILWFSRSRSDWRGGEGCLYQIPDTETSLLSLPKNVFRPLHTAYAEAVTASTDKPIIFDRHRDKGG